MNDRPDEFDDELTATVDRLARLAAGDDDASYVPLFMLAYNTAHSVQTADAKRRPELAAAMLDQLKPVSQVGRGATRAAGQAGKSLQEDPVYLANQRLVIVLNTRITAGRPTSDFPDCVAVGSERGFCCTGTLVAPNVVVSAAHCPVQAGCDKRVFIGDDVEGPGRIIDVERSVVHPDYVSGGQGFDDLVVLVLAEEVDDVTPCKVASPEAVAGARTTRLVGFGNTDFAGTSGYGERRMVDVGIASDDPAFGARPETEFVAGAPGLNRDSCTGDSGGPAYIDVDGEWRLAGATSRGTRLAGRACGDGGIYTRVPAYRGWIESVAGPIA